MLFVFLGCDFYSETYIGSKSDGNFNLQNTILRLLVKYSTSHNTSKKIIQIMKVKEQGNTFTSD